MKIKTASVDSVIIYFGDIISQEIAKEVRCAYNAIKTSKLKGIIDVIPAYVSVYVKYDILEFTQNEIEKKLKDIILSSNSNDSLEERLVKVPVLYDEEVGLDLSQSAKKLGLSVDELVKIHSQKVYFVYAIGFLPGFGYMGEVDDRLILPRLENPRVRIPKGSVGIAQRQTAIYPKQSPGGWNILGLTPICLFDVKNGSFLKAGDSVKFEPISKKEFEKLANERT